VRERWYRSGYYRDETLSSALRRAAREHADTPFRFHTVRGLRETTVGEIGRDAVRLGGALGVMGLRPGQVIAVQLPTCYETAVLYVAALHSGATVLPIVHTYGPAELDFILKDSRAQWLAIPGEWRGIDYVERCARTPAVDALQGVIVLGDRPVPRGIAWRELVERAAQSLRLAPVAQHADERSVLLYTSGTTARPKGVVHSHNTIRSEWEIPFFANRGPFLNPFPAGHIAGFNFILRPMLCGVPMVFMDRFDPDVAAELVQRYAVTQSGGTPYFLQTLLEAAQRGRHDLSSIRAYGLGATGVTAEHVRLTDELGWRGGRSYGLTEHSTVSCTYPDMPFSSRAYTDGRIQPGSEVRIVDEAGAEVALGAEGEILTRGPELFLGYTDPDLTQEAFAGDWFRTGDIGRCDAEGFLTITDRKKDIIIRGGENISSREVEEMLLRHPDVRDVATVSMPDARLGEKVCAFVVPRGAHALDLETLSRHCLASGLARFKVPERLELVTELPRNAAGKVRKDELRNRLKSNP
jgi:acyl-CoA synthetase